MCTVSFIPFSNGGYSLTSNRDEYLRRKSALLPAIKKVHGHTILAPIDGHAKGTWIFASTKGISVCLLNGAFEPYDPAQVFRKSRGVILLEILKYSSVDKFINDIDLKGIAPFTLIIIQDRKKTQKLYEFIWDGESKYVRYPSAEKPQIWSSCTLYDVSIRKKRELFFDDWIQREYFGKNRPITDFHLLDSRDNAAIPIILKSEIHGTVSMTSLTYEKARIRIDYYDLINDKTYSKSINKPALLDTAAAI